MFGCGNERCVWLVDVLVVVVLCLWVVYYGGEYRGKFVVVFDD